jgi:hypothetical protein
VTLVAFERIERLLHELPGRDDGGVGPGLAPVALCQAQEVQRLDEGRARGWVVDCAAVGAGRLAVGMAASDSGDVLVPVVVDRPTVAGA